LAVEKLTNVPPPVKKKQQVNKDAMIKRLALERRTHEESLQSRQEDLDTEAKHD